MKNLKTDNLDLIFGKTKGMPKYVSIPDDFKGDYNKNKWLQLISDLFFIGLQEIKLTPKEGVNKEEAFKHIVALLRSWEFKHEHKEAGCAYLFSQSFDNIEWITKKGEKKQILAS
jgi:hypothetical protein